jgi:predicted kinase
MKVVNSDNAFEKLLKDAGLSLKMPPEEEKPRDVVRTKAKAITKSQQKNYVEGRLGLIIDGTGRDFEKIAKQARELQGLGYDTHMIFVNTSLDTALERNAKRARSVPEPIVVKSWKDVQSNIGKFSQFFRRNFIVVDNNDADEDVFGKVYKQVMHLAKAKVQNTLGKQWISNELAKRSR